MMGYAVDALTAMGHREIVLWAPEENRRARRFYERYGFVFDGAKKEIEIGGKALTEVRYTLTV